MPARCLGDMQSSEHVDCAITSGIGHRRGHAGLRREVEDGSGAELVERRSQRRSVGDVDPRKGRWGRQPARVARREVVDDEHLVAVAHERVDDVRADEACPSGHQRPPCHHVSLRRVGTTTYDSSANAIPTSAPSTIAMPSEALLPPAVTLLALAGVMTCVCST